MSNESASKCPQCGAPLKESAPAGLCPNCLMALNLKTETVLSGEARPTQPPLPPEQIAPHFLQLEILECLGRGGMGVVYKARQKSLNRFVALKLLAPERAGDPAFAARFEKEARALAVLNHPNIVTIYDHGQAGGFYFLLMEFVDGVTLRQLLEKERVSTREALAIVPQICDALQFAHDAGIVHRDIKPENILLDRRGRVKVADFGLAKIVGNEPLTPSLSPSDGERVAKPGEGSPVLTDAGKVMGTPQYMSPEQIQAPGEVDHRADIYALGVVFYQMLTGELPGKKIEPPSKMVHIDVRLDEVVLRALERKPELRYQQISALKTQVETIAGGSGRESAHTESGHDQSLHTSTATTQKSRFSRTAIVGACWLVFPLVSLAQVVAAKLFPPDTLVQSPLWWFGGFLGQRLLALTAPLGITILGWVAVVQIRRSAGKLRGLELAVFNGLLFPLLALDAGIIALELMGRTVTTASHLSNVTARMTTMPIPTALLLLTIIGVVDWLIIRRVWRAANKGVAAETAQEPPDKLPPFAFAIAMAYTLTPLFCAFCGLVTGSSMGDDIVMAFVGIGILSLVLGFVLKNHASEKTQRAWRFAAAGFAFVAALPVMGFALFFFFAMTQERGGWHPNPVEALLVPLTWLGAVLLPVSFWRLARGVARWLGATVFAVFLLGGFGLAVYSASEDRLFAQQLEREMRGNVAAAERISNHGARTESQLKFGPLLERIISESEANSQGLVFFDFETGLRLPPPFPLLLRSNTGPAFVELSTELLQWVQSNRMDLLIQFTATGWDVMNFRMQEDYLAQCGDFDRVTADEVAQVFAAKDAAGLVRDEIPAFSFGHAFDDQRDYCKAFRTRSNTEGVMQWSGLKTTPRGVKIRYKLVEGDSRNVWLSPATSAVPIDSLPLAVAVNAFNAFYANDAVGKIQPPLTEDEVLASIRTALADRNTLLVSDATVAELERVWRTRRLPKQFELEVLSSYQPDDSTIQDVWSVRLRIPGGTIPNGTTCIRIREVDRGSRMIGPHERAVMERWRTNASSFERVEATAPMRIVASTYEPERKAAIEQDKVEAAQSTNSSPR